MVTLSPVGCSASFRSVSLDILPCICIRGRILPDGVLAVLIDVPVRWSALGRLPHLSVGCELSLSLLWAPGFMYEGICWAVCSWSVPGWHWDRQAGSEGWGFPEKLGGGGVGC